MPEAEPGAAAAGTAGSVQGMTQKQLDQLADLVYRLMKDEILRGRERRGESMARGWR